MRFLWAVILIFVISLRATVAAQDRLQDAIALYQAGHFEDALKIFNQILEDNPDDSDALSYRGAIYLALKDPDKALIDLNRALELKPDDAFTLSLRGEAYLYSGKFDEALIDLNRSLEVNPDSYFALDRRSQVYMIHQDYDAAIIDISHMLKLSPDDTYALDERASLYNEQGKYDLALKDYSRILELQPDDVRTLNARANVYRQMKNYNKAVVDFTHLIDLGEKYALVQRGITHHLAKEYDLALKDYNLDLESNPRDVFTLYNRAETLYAMGQYEDAVIDIRQVFLRYPYIPKEYYLYYRTQLQLYKQAEAKGK